MIVSMRICAKGLLSSIPRNADVYNVDCARFVPLAIALLVIAAITGGLTACASTRSKPVAAPP
jgi:hypothetical protein